MLLVLGDEGILLELLDLLDGVAADGAHGDLRVLGFLLDLLGQILAALGVQLGEDQADDLAVIVGIQAQIAGLDGLFDGLEHVPFPGLDDHHAGFGHGHVADLVQGRGRAVIIHGDAVQQLGIGAAGADGLHIILQHGDGFIHLGLCLIENFLARHGIISFIGENDCCTYCTLFWPDWQEGSENSVPPAKRLPSRGRWLRVSGD